MTLLSPLIVTNPNLIRIITTEFYFYIEKAWVIIVFLYELLKRLVYNIIKYKINKQVK